MSLDLPLLWAMVIALAVFLYVVLDGFDLGVGILFPFARNPADRDTMMAAIAPYWDGNETWLVLGGGGLFAAFPGAYAALMPAFYLPIILMLTQIDRLLLVVGADATLAAMALDYALRRRGPMTR